MTNEQLASDAHAYALAIISETPRTSLVDVVIAAMCAFTSMHDQSPASRVGCAKAVETYCIAIGLGAVRLAAPLPPGAN